MGEPLKSKSSMAYPTWSDLLRNFLKDCDCERGIDSMRDLRLVLDQIAEAENLHGIERIKSMAVILRQMLSEIPVWTEHRSIYRWMENCKSQAEIGQSSVALYDCASLELVFRRDQPEAIRGVSLLDILHQALVPSELNGGHLLPAHFAFQRSLAVALLVLKFFPPDRDLVDTIHFQKMLGNQPSECTPLFFGSLELSFVLHNHKGAKARTGLLCSSKWFSGLEETVQAIPMFHSHFNRANKMRVMWYLLNALLCDLSTKYVFVLFAKSRNIKNTETALFINEKMQQIHGMSEVFNETQISDLMSKSIRSNIVKCYTKTFGSEPAKLPSQDFSILLNAYQLGLLPLPEVLQQSLIREIIPE